MTGKIFRSTLFVAAVVLLCSLAIIVGVAYDYFDAIQVKQLQEELSLAVTGTQQQGIVYLQNVEAQRFRLTWVLADGTVIYDTQEDETAMENHARREEIAEALETGSGSSVRYSATRTEKTVYEAVRLADGTVLRISVSSVTTATLVLGMLQPVCVIIAIAIVLSAILSHRMAKRFVEPLNRLNLEDPLENDTYEELAPLLSRVNQQHMQIRAQMRTLKRKTDEFAQITENMAEGLVLLDKDGLVLSINPAAKRLFGASDLCLGKDFRVLDGAAELRNAVSDAFLNDFAELNMSRGGRQYRLAIDRIESEGSVIGAVILAFDNTEALDAERSCREFSANVSHELKTPLQSIMGSAELLENGLVKPEDAPRFVGHIRKEAARLVDLVEDIIRLSQLDEGGPLPLEEVDLLALAEETVATLQKAASAADVTVTVAGSAGVIKGSRRLLYEIIYNLCDNAIKYNVPGGTATVSLEQIQGRAALSVSDTGIGIPAEHQTRVFERFYRVDKSHSKLSGGTGLFFLWEFLSNTAEAWNIAVIHTTFNLAATAVLMPMNGLLVKLAYLIVPEVKEPEKEALLDQRLLATPAVAVQRAKEIAGRMADTSAQAMELAIGLTRNYDDKVMEQVRALEDETDRYEDALGSYLVQLTGKELSVEDGRVLNTLLYTISDLERIADHAVSVAKAGLEMDRKNIQFSQQAQQELTVLESAVMDIIRHTVTAFADDDLVSAVKVEPQEQVVDVLVKEVKSRHVRRLRDGLCTVEYGFVLEDLLTAYERSADHCSNVAVEMLQVAEGKLEAHEYLNALKAGELRESAQFAEQFNAYRAQYIFPEDAGNN